MSIPVTYSLLAGNHLTPAKILLSRSCMSFLTTRVIPQVVEWRRLIWDSDSQEHFVASCPHLGTDASRDTSDGSNHGGCTLSSPEHRDHGAGGGNSPSADLPRPIVHSLD